MAVTEDNSTSESVITRGLNTHVLQAYERLSVVTPFSLPSPSGNDASLV